MKRLGDFLNQKVDRGRQGVSEAERRQFIERWLRKKLKEESVYCEAAGESEVVIRVPAGAWVQEVYVGEDEMRRVLREELEYVFKNLRATCY